MLDEILSHKTAFLRNLDGKIKISGMHDFIYSLSPVRSLKNAIIKDPGISLIAEIKRRSPSRKPFKKLSSPDEYARVYEKAGASGISVITEKDFFDGSVEDLIDARFSTGLPVLRKDFIIDPFQVIESRYIGADAILLIAAIVSLEKLRELYNLARQIGLEVLLEIHNERELESALKLDPDIIGINNRDLKSFKISLDVTRRLAPMIPRGITIVSESGISTREDILELQDYGVDGVLIGEAIIRNRDQERIIRELLGKGND